MIFERREFNRHPQYHRPLSSSLVAESLAALRAGAGPVPAGLEHAARCSSIHRFVMVHKNSLRRVIMAESWAMLCEANDLLVDEPYVDVQFGDERRHRVTVKEHDESYFLSAFVVRQATASAIPDLAVRAWLRNRATLLVGFRIDHKGRLVGEAWVPKAGLVATEFQFCLRQVTANSAMHKPSCRGRSPPKLGAQ
jgi:hypothetical protein